MKLTLRELFLLVALVGVSLGWWLNRQQWQADYQWLVSEVGRENVELEQFDERPTGFPEQIEVAEVEAFLKGAPAERVGGVESRHWEGPNWWQSYFVTYDSPVETPWIEGPVDVTCRYASAGLSDNHLMYLILDGQKYARGSRSELTLRWQRRWVH